LNKLLLKEATQEHVTYFYQPEGRGKFGVISMMFGIGEPEVESLAEEDSQTGHYAFKAKLAVENIVQKKNFPLEYTQAWY
jgi:hypothetical protein